MLEGAWCVRSSVAARAPAASPPQPSKTPCESMSCRELRRAHTACTGSQRLGRVPQEGEAPNEGRPVLRWSGDAASGLRPEHSEADGADRLSPDSLARDEVLRSLWAQGLHPLPRLPCRRRQELLPQLRRVRLERLRIERRRSAARAAAERRRRLAYHVRRYGDQLDHWAAPQRRRVAPRRRE